MNRVIYNNSLNTTAEIKDVGGIFDIQAVENSIDNIITTDPGQKILNPTFGLDLKEFIFPEKFDDYYAWKMETKIWDELPGQELRIIVQSVKVRANPEDRAWNVAITYDVEALKAYNLTWAAILKGGVFNRVEAPKEVYDENMKNLDDDPLNSCICSLPVEQKMLEPPIPAEWGKTPTGWDKQINFGIPGEGPGMI